MKHSFLPLRESPTDYRHWHELAAQYAEQGWVWQAHYCQNQAERCASLHRQAVPALATLENPASPVRERQAFFQAHSPQYQGRAQWTEAPLLAEAFQEALRLWPKDWLAMLYLLRLADLAPTPAGLTVPTLAQAQALEWTPGETVHLWADWRLQAGDAQGALDLLKPLVAVSEDRPLRHSSMLLLADALLRLGQIHAAELALTRAARSPNPVFLARVAERSLAWNYWAEAVALRRQIVQMQPESAQSWLALAQTEFTVSQSGDALRSVARALALQPDMPEARVLQAQIQGQTGEGESYFEVVRELHAQGNPLSRMASTVAMASLYANTLSAQERAQLHFDLCAPIEASVQPIYPAPEAKNSASRLRHRRQRDRLRVGYLSGDLHRQHPVNLFMLPILMHHDPQKIEVFIYHTGQMHDQYTARARNHAATWREVGGWTDAQLAQQIHADELDLLVDTAGHTSSHRLGVLAQRPAPVQATFLGYPHSTGMRRIDWLIGDPIVSPLTDQALYSERIAQMPNTVFCWAPVDHDPLPKRPGLGEPGEVVLGSFNNAMKLVPRTLDLWAKVMQALPKARLLIKAPGLRDPRIEAHFRAALIERGIAPERFELRGPTGLVDMMQEYGEVDIALDPTPYNGGTTTAQALWMGTPVITLSGENFVGRMGTSFLTALGHPEWAAQTESQYIDAVVRLAMDTKLLSGLHRSLREQVITSPLGDIRSYTRHFEDLLHRMAFEDHA